MNKQLAPSDFCFKWVPRLFNIEFGDYRYRSVSIKLLANLTDSQDKTCDNWLNLTAKTPAPLLVQRFLFVLDQLWEIEWNLHRQFSQVPYEIKPLSVEKFCASWIPRRTGLDVEQRGYRKACSELLAKLSGKKVNTCRNWLNKTQTHSPPDILGKYLRVIHILWQVELLLPPIMDYYQSKSLN